MTCLASRTWALGLALLVMPALPPFHQLLGRQAVVPLLYAQAIALLASTMMVLVVVVRVALWADMLLGLVILRVWTVAMVVTLLPWEARRALIVSVVVRANMPLPTRIPPIVRLAVTPAPV